jgi:hypothetical protein
MHNPYYIPYVDACQLLGISQHGNQLRKRQQKYPQHFTVQDGVLHISKVLLEALKDYHQSLQYLITLKQQEVNHGN